MTWIALFDESGTNGHSPLIYMGCVLARGDQWKGFDADWKQVLDDYGVPYAHGSEMLHRKGPYKDWDSGRVNEFGFKLEKLYHKHLYAGAVALMRKDDYDAQYAALIPSKMRRNTQLGVLFRVCVRRSHLDLERRAVKDRVHVAIGGHDAKRQTHFGTEIEAALQPGAAGAGAGGVQRSRRIDREGGDVARHQRQRRAPLATAGARGPERTRDVPD
jgi:hypothetical protein